MGPLLQSMLIPSNSQAVLAQSQFQDVAEIKMQDGLLDECLCLVDVSLLILVENYQEDVVINFCRVSHAW